MNLFFKTSHFVVSVTISLITLYCLPFSKFISNKNEFKSSSLPNWESMKDPQTSHFTIKRFSLARVGENWLRWRDLHVNSKDPAVPKTSEGCQEYPLSSFSVFRDPFSLWSCGRFTSAPQSIVLTCLEHHRWVSPPKIQLSETTRVVWHSGAHVNTSCSMKLKSWPQHEVTTLAYIESPSISSSMVIAASINKENTGYYSLAASPRYNKNKPTGEQLSRVSR